MSSSKVAVICGLAVALLLAGCGVAAKPEAGTPHLKDQPGFHGVYDDQRPTRATCLRQDGIHFIEFTTKDEIGGTPQMLQAIKITGKPHGATIIFYPEAEIAEGMQIMGQDEGSELIGSALLFPNDTTGRQLTTVETCVASGVGA